jgi:hypothetical protein
MQTDFSQAILLPLPFTSPEKPAAWLTDSSYLRDSISQRELKGSLISSQAQTVMQKEGFKTKTLLEMPFSLLYGDSESVSNTGLQEKVLGFEMKDQVQVYSRESENSQARCSSQVSRSSSPKLIPLSVQQFSQMTKMRRRSRANNDQTSKLSISANSRNSKLDWETQTKVCIDLLIRAVEEDLGRGAKKCANTYCEIIQQFGVKPETNERDIRGLKEWLCDSCVQAYDRNQFCEFCRQIYLDSVNEAAALDGEEWAQCEASEDCRRWVHVRCLAAKLNKTREMIMAESFKYKCCTYNVKFTGKRKKSYIK